MKAPGTAYNDPKVGKDNQAANMKDYVMADQDNGGVHINSGIPKRAFYFAATPQRKFCLGDRRKGVVCCHDYGNAEERIYHFPDRTVTEAKNLLDDPDLTPIIEQAWKDVGVLPSSSGLFGWMWGRKA